MNKSLNLEEEYNRLKLDYDNYLKDYNVKLPKLKINNSYTLNSLVLLYLYKNIGKIVTKQELTDYLRTLGYEINDVQQARHLGQQMGWYVLSGTRGDTECKEFNVGPGEYMLKTVEQPYPSYSNLRRNETLDVSSFEQLKELYDYRCATCGSKEGKNNFLYPASTTFLQQGHKDPGKPLSLDNTIPQCQFCNRASRNYFVFDNKGRVEKIYDPRFIMRSDKEIKVNMLKLLIEEDLELAKKILQEISNKN